MFYTTLYALEMLLYTYFAIVIELLLLLIFLSLFLFFSMQNFIFMFVLFYIFLWFCIFFLNYIKVAINIQILETFSFPPVVSPSFQFLQYFFWQVFAILLLRCDFCLVQNTLFIIVKITLSQLQNISIQQLQITVIFLWNPKSEISKVVKIHKSPILSDLTKLSIRYFSNNSIYLLTLMPGHP